MSRLKKNTLILFTIFISSLGHSSLNAYCANCPGSSKGYSDCYNGQGKYNGTCCFDGWKVYADWIYWRVSRPGLDYVIEGSAPEEQFILSVDPKRESGFRIGWENAMPSYALGVLYTHFSSNFDNTAILDPIFATRSVLTTLDSGAVVTYEAPASANYDIHLNYIDFIISKLSLCPKTNYYVIPYAAVRIGRLEEAINTEYNRTVDGIGELVNLEEQVNTNVYGLMVGLRAAWVYCRSNTLFIECDIGSLTGTARQKSNEFITIDDTETHTVQLFNSECPLVFISEMKIGLDFDIGPLFGGYISLQVGYELNNWYKLTDFLEILENNFVSPTLSVIDQKTNLQMDGIFIRLNADF